MFSDFPYRCTKNISNRKKNWARYYYKSTQVFKYSVRYSCQILKKLEFFSRYFRKKNAQISNIMKIYFVAAKFFHANWRTEREDNTNSRFSQFLQKRLQSSTSCCNGFKYFISNEKLINVINAYSVFLGGGGRGGGECYLIEILEVYSFIFLLWDKLTHRPEFEWVTLNSLFIC